LRQFIEYKQLNINTMDDLYFSLSKQISQYYSLKSRVKVITKFGEFIGTINSFGGSSTQSGKGGIFEVFTITRDGEESGDLLYLTQVVNIIELKRN